MSDKDMIVLVQTLLNYLIPTKVPEIAEIEATIHRFKSLSPEYSTATSPH
jgi:hypothetical protein